MTPEEGRKFVAEHRARMAENPHDKQHLGDGAYVEVGSFAGEVVLSAPREHGEHRVVLDEQGTLNLITWLQLHGWKIRLGRPPGEARTFVIRPVDKDDAYEGRLEDRET